MILKHLTKTNLTISFNTVLRQYLVEGKLPNEGIILYSAPLLK